MRLSVASQEPLVEAGKQDRGTGGFAESTHVTAVERDRTPWTGNKKVD